MAKIVHLATRHDCREEIAADIRDDVYFGTIVECSCGKQYILSEDQREGAYWAEHDPPEGRDPEVLGQFKLYAPGTSVSTGWAIHFGTGWQPGIYADRDAVLFACGYIAGGEGCGTLEEVWEANALDPINIHHLTSFVDQSEEK